MPYITTKTLTAPRSTSKAVGTFQIRVPYDRDTTDRTLVRILDDIPLVDGKLTATDIPAGPYEVRRNIKGAAPATVVAWTPFVIPATAPVSGAPGTIDITLGGNTVVAWNLYYLADQSIPYAPAVVQDAQAARDAAQGYAAAAATSAARLDAVVAGAPTALDTLDELAAALGDDANFAATITTALSGKYTKPGSGIPLTDIRKADLDAAYAPGSAPLRSFYSPRNASNLPIPGTFTSVKVSSDAATFTNPTTFGVPDLPSCVTFLGGPARMVYSNSWWINDLAKVEAVGTITVSFFTDNQHFVLEGLSYGVGDVKVYADDVPFSSGAIVHSLAYQAAMRVEVTMPSKRMRRFEITVGSAALMRVIGEKNCTFTPAPAPRVRAAFIGDSWLAGAVKAAGTVSGSALPEYLRIASGLDVCVVAEGGTSYTRPGDSGSGFEAFGGATRMAGVVRTDPDVVIVAGSVNDYAATQSAIQAAATALYAALATQLPGVPVIVVGAQPVGLTSTDYDKCNTAVLAAAAAAPNVVGVIDWRGEKWLTGSGKVGTVAGDGNSDFYLSADGLHPEQVGDEYLGHRLAGALGAVRVTLKPRTKGVGAGSGTGVALAALNESIAARPTKALADSTYAPARQTYSALARTPDVLIAGTITRDSNGAATSAPVVWPDGSPGMYTGTPSSSFPGAIDSYTITYGSPVTKTYTQPAVTRDSTSGAVTQVPAITVA